MLLLLIRDLVAAEKRIALSSLIDRLPDRFTVLLKLIKFCTNPVNINRIVRVVNSIMPMYRDNFLLFRLPLDLLNTIDINHEHFLVLCINLLSPLLHLDKTVVRLWWNICSISVIFLSLF